MLMFLEQSAVAANLTKQWLLAAEDSSLSPRRHLITSRVLVPTLSPCPEFGQGSSDDDHPLLGNGRWGRTYVLLASGEPSTATTSHGLCGGLESTPNHQHEAPITERAASRSSIPVTPEKYGSILSLPAVVCKSFPGWRTLVTF